MDDALLGRVIDRLDGVKLADRATEILLAACEGHACLDAVLTDGEHRQPVGPGPEMPCAEPAGAYLGSITVQAFRGIGQPATLPLAAGPGLTVVTGRNGSGKSSFAEALEVLLTGGLRHWNGLPAVWRDGWRNMHAGLPTELAAALYLEDAGPADVRRTWAADAGLENNTATVQVVGDKRTGIERLGWGEDLAIYRPFLSHAELELFFSGKPSDLYELLASVLGLDDLTETTNRLAAARLVRENAGKAVRHALAPLLDELAGLDDERAAACREALAGRVWDLDRVDAVVTGSAAADPAGDLVRLRRIAQLSAPTIDEVSAAADTLTSVADELDAVSHTDAGRAAELAHLLRAALAHHRRAGDGPCPVCQSEAALDDAWHAATEAEAARLEQEAKEATAAAERARAAWTTVRSLVQPTPEALSADDLVGSVDVTSARTAWQAWARPPDGEGADALRVVARHLTTTWDALDRSMAATALAATEEITAREDRWAPLAARLAGWSADARNARDDAADVASIRAAERWLKDAIDDIRNALFEPLAEDARAIWSELRQESNVELGAIRLTGSSTRRQVAIDVEVDGSASAGLSVMSQGEVNALALSVFLPRATMSESPFRFLVIDDPVQAMDSAKVDGLARVLDRVARERQVVVFTHDDRLAEALRRLEIAATVLEVTRQPGSRVSVQTVMDPAQRALKDAADVSSDRTLPVEVAARVVGALCRTALEAGLTEIARRRLLHDGVQHDDADDSLRAAKKLYQKAALAMFSDMERTAEVLARLAQIDRRHPATFKTLNSAAHMPVSGDLWALIGDTRRLVEQLRSVFE